MRSRAPEDPESLRSGWATFEGRKDKIGPRASRSRRSHRLHEAIWRGQQGPCYETAKALANIVPLSEIPTTYDKRAAAGQRGQPAAAGVPNGKTFFGVILADQRCELRGCGRVDLQPTEVVGFQMINPATGAL
jgi:hypothetical protein